MILFITKSSRNPSRDNIYKWLDFFNVEYFVLNVDCLFDYDIIYNGDKFTINGIELKFFKIVFPWINLNNINESNADDFDEYDINSSFSIINSISFEIKSFIFIIQNYLVDRYWVFNLKKLSYFSKTEAIIASKDFGLNSLDFLLTTMKDSVLSYIKERNDLICKNIDDSGKNYLKKKHNNDMFISKPSLVKREILSSSPKNFNISYFQQYVGEQKEELRVFIFEDYCIGTRFHFDSETKLDSNKLKYFRYSLSNKIKEKLYVIMELYGFKMCSFDFMIDRNQNFQLIDINPIGQFSFEEKKLDYNISYEIAIRLKTKIHELQNI